VVGQVEESRGGCAEVELQVSLKQVTSPPFPQHAGAGRSTTAKPANYGVRQRPEAPCFELSMNDLDLRTNFHRQPLAHIYKHVPNGPSLAMHEFDARSTPRKETREYAYSMRNWLS
jgi:hypothetical protein